MESESIEIVDDKLDDMEIDEEFFPDGSLELDKFKQIRSLLGMESSQHSLTQNIVKYSNSVKSKIKTDFQNYMERCKSMYIRSIAPGQEANFEKMFLSTLQSSKENESKLTILNSFKGAFESCLNRKSRILVLSCIPSFSRIFFEINSRKFELHKKRTSCCAKNISNGRSMR